VAGANNLKLWLLTDGAPGHWSQSQGIADALAQVHEVEILRVMLKVRSSLWKRLGRLCLPWIRNPAFWLARVYDLKLPVGQPDLIISSGANTLLANALLARQRQAPNTYSGTLKGYDASAYRVIFTVVGLGVPNNCVLPLPPVPADIFNVPALAVGSEPLVAVLVGGDGAGYEFRDEDWQAMAAWLNELAAERGARLLLTTSRRTGVDAERLLKAALPADALAQAVWWSEAQQPVVRDFLSRASCVVVTEESLTMVAESIYARRQVYTLMPRSAAPNDNDGRALAAYAEAGLIQRIPLAQPTQAIPGGPELVSGFPDVPQLIRSALEPYLAGKQVS
jgi:mitochondrial fission protein ELM1